MRQSLYFVVFVWITFALQQAISLFIPVPGIIPRTAIGLIGILLAPLLHGSLYHILANTLPLFFLLWITLFQYKKSASGVVLGIVLLGGSLVWIFGRSANHVGASGLIYGLAAFLVVSGVVRKNLLSIATAALVLFLYGGMVYGILPRNGIVSWESHLFGALSGGVMAYLTRKSKEKREE